MRPRDEVVWNTFSAKLGQSRCFSQPPLRAPTNLAGRSSFALLHRLGCPCPRIARHNDVTEADEAQTNKPSQFDLPALGFPSLHFLGRSPSSMSYHPVSTAQQKTHPSAPLSLLALPEHAWLGQDFGTLVSSSVLRTDAKKSTECLWPFNLLDSNP